MTTYDNSAPMGATGLPQPPRWVCVLLGLFMVLAGLMVLGDIAFFTVVSALFIGWPRALSKFSTPSGPRAGAASSGRSSSACSILPSALFWSPSR
ncbi:hypothetical protein [Bradyrhizobium sp. 159]|uniref:hypothetical protein n=1 Tax=Bradyrhizobium sp. 159 TaxID=2782632 RepID=UPI0031FEB6D5